MDLRKTGWGSVDWIQLAHNRDRWRAVVNTVMNLRVLAPRSYYQDVTAKTCRSMYYIYMYIRGGQLD
jgi:hypothetical protein